MNSRSKKYHESRKRGNKNKKAASSPPGSQNKETFGQPKEDSLQAEQTVKLAHQESSASQDDTGGGNDSGKRIDEN